MCVMASLAVPTVFEPFCWLGTSSVMFNRPQGNFSAKTLQLSKEGSISASTNGFVAIFSDYKYLLKYGATQDLQTGENK